MNIYSVSVLNGRETVERYVFLHSVEAKPVIRAEEFKEQFIIVDTYYSKNNKRKLFEEEEHAMLVRSSLFLRGEEVLRKKEKVTFDDIDSIKEMLTLVIKEDGTKYYMPETPISCQETIDIIGTEIFTMHIVKDEPQRWATISFDPDQHGLKEQPTLNKYASEMFGIELYGTVIYVNENLVS